MKFSVLILCVICLDHIKASTVGNLNDNGTEHEEEKWSWGYIDNLNSSIQETTSSTTQLPSRIGSDEENPCNRVPSPMPDFSAPGRRISEQKCYEYIWNIKHREEVENIDKACTNYIIEKANGLGIIGINRRDAQPGEFPHMGAMGWKAVEGTWIFSCGSSLISSRFAMTAAHCSKASDRDTRIADVDPKIVRFGDKNIIDSKEAGVRPTDANIKNIITHPNYSSPKKYFDIALIELEKDIEFNYNVQPACLWKNFDVDVKTKATIIGWGVVDVASHNTSPILQVAEVDIIDSETCDKLLSPYCSRLWCGIQDTEICAGDLSGGTDTCQGDSGGPLQVKINLPTNAQGAMHYVIGVTSFGFKCALKNTPGVYTRVSSFLDWIESIVWK